MAMGPGERAQLETAGYESQEVQQEGEAVQWTGHSAGGALCTFKAQGSCLETAVPHLGTMSLNFILYG